MDTQKIDSNRDVKTEYHYDKMAHEMELIEWNELVFLIDYSEKFPVYLVQYQLQFWSFETYSSTSEQAKDSE